MDGKIRVFISYSTKDADLVDELAQNIQDAGMEPLWTKNLPAGTGFHEEIKSFIQHAHVFMPILSESSSIWVQHEIGYAMAHNIPVLPVTTENIDPGGMLEIIQAIKMRKEGGAIKEQIKEKVFKGLIGIKSKDAIYVRAAVVEERAKLMTEYADKLIFINKYGLVRQKGGLSSFHIPDVQINRKVWNDRYSPGSRSDYHKELQRNERIALQDHFNHKGCKLIVDPSYALYILENDLKVKRSSIAARVRIKCLIEFLESISDDKVVIAIQNKAVDVESLTIVGDWFLAESVSFRSGGGFTNTFFTRNANEISNRIAYFDSELHEILEERGWTEANSRLNAIEELTKIIKTIKD